MDYSSVLLAALALAAGGVLKGAVGAGAPILAVPILALLYDVPLAVAIFTLPNLMANLWQGWAFRTEQLAARFVWTFALTGAAGAGVGSLLLAILSGEMLMAVLAMFVFIYIGVRLLKPGWFLTRALADRLAPVAGFVGGVMQGAGGVSAPVSVTFLNSMRLERGQFIATISVLFAAMSAVQIPALWSLGILTPERMAYSALAALPLFVGMPVGAWLARFISREKFDRIILGLLAVIALRLLYHALV